MQPLHKLKIATFVVISTSSWITALVAILVTNEINGKNMEYLTVHRADEIVNFYWIIEREPEEKYGKFLSPYFEVEIVDREQNFIYATDEPNRSLEGYNWRPFDKQLISSIEFEEDQESADKIQLTLKSPTLVFDYPLFRDAMFRASDIFKEGNSIDLFMGYDNHPRIFMARGVITKIEPDFASDTIPSLTVTAHDISYFMMEEGRTEIIPDGSHWWNRRRQRADDDDGENPCIPLDEVTMDDIEGSEVSRNSDGELFSYVGLRPELEDPELEDPEVILDSELQGESESETNSREESGTEDDHEHRMSISGAFGGAFGSIQPADVHDDSDYEDAGNYASEQGVIEIGDISSSPLDEDEEQADGDIEEDAGSTPEDNEEENSNEESETSPWERQQFSNRKTGHVWRGMTDSEIVAEIFMSYGIVPYVKFTTEARITISEGSEDADSIDESETGLGGQYPIMIDGQYVGLHPELEDPELEDPEVILDSELQGESESETNSREESEEDNGRTLTDTGFDFAFGWLQPGHIRVSENSENYASEQGVGGNDNSTSSEEDEEETTEEENPEEFDPTDYDLSHLNICTPENIEEEEEENSSGEQRRVVQKAGTTDWDFIQKLAEKHDFISFVFFDYESRLWIGYWGPEELIPQYQLFVLKYNALGESSIANVRPSINTRNQSTEIELVYVDPISGRENKLKVKATDTLDYVYYPAGSVESVNTQNDPVGDGPEVVLTIHGRRIHTRADQRFTSAEDARQWLAAYWSKHAKDFQIIEGTTRFGIPELRGRKYHRFQGIGRYSGKYFLTHTRHKMGDSKYVTDFTGHKKPNLNIEEVDDSHDLGEQETNME